MAEVTARATLAGHDPHAWSVVVDRGDGRVRTLQALGVLDADGRAWVWIDGETVRHDAAETVQVRAMRHGDAGLLASPMPATVLSVLVAVGDRVAQGDTLVLLEAMKMELPLKAPHAGVVADLRCAPGDLVQPGTALVTLTEAADDGA